MTTPLRPVASSIGSRPIRTAARPPRRAEIARAAGRRRGRRSCRRDGELDRDAVRLARSGCRRARCRSRRRPSRALPSSTNAQSPRETSAIAPRERAGGQRRGARRSRLPGGAAEVPRRPAGRRRRRSSRRRRAPGRSWPKPPAPGGAAATKGTRVSAAGAPAAVTASAGAKTWVFESAATEIASGAVPGEPVEPSPYSSRSLPAEMTGTTPAAATLRTASTSASLAGSVCGPPPEKLITSMPSRHRRLERGHDLRRVADVADRRRHVEDAVVADLGARRDAARGPVVVGMVARLPARSCRRSRPRCRRRACRGTRRRGSSGEPAAGVRRRRRRTSARRSPWASSTSCRPSGSRPDS